ncbi:hypothetical protein N7475_008387 [Penicillium sp. IBT 31633x]|nr:hypothetical protein N7475_008387 [Penicillium sp. IBT 31633x]
MFLLSYRRFMVVTAFRPELRCYLLLIRNILTKGSRPTVKSIVRFDNTRAIIMKLSRSDSLYVYRVDFWSSLVTSDHASLKKID